MSDEALRERFDAAGEHAQGGIAFWGDLLVFRATMRAAEAQQAQAAEMRDLTVQITRLTRGIFWLTVAVFAVTIAGVVTTIVG